MASKPRPRTENELLEQEQALVLAALAETAQSLVGTITAPLPASARRHPALIAVLAAGVGAIAGRRAVRPLLRSLRVLAPMASAWLPGALSAGHPLGAALGAASAGRRAARVVR